MRLVNYVLKTHILPYPSPRGHRKPRRISLEVWKVRSHRQNHHDDGGDCAC